MVFGKQGCTLHYDINLIGILKTNGTIWYKGEKSKFVESRYSAWSDGKLFYRIDKKKKTIELHRSDSPKRDQYASKFIFVPDNYKYHIAANNDEFIITLKAKKGVDGIKHVKAIIDKRTRYPKSLKIKIFGFWTTVKISNFHSGIEDESIFVFPRSQYSHYKFLDKRE